MRRSLAAAVLALTLAAAPAQAAPFIIRTVGAATAVAVDLGSVAGQGELRTGWSYEFLRERNPLLGRRTQIIAARELVNCRTEAVRHLELAHYRADGTLIRRTSPPARWTETLSGSSTDLILKALCRGPDPAWARRSAASVFALYRGAW